jgi:drug/metabolite transporter (DMT)-like permease
VDENRASPENPSASSGVRFATLMLLLATVGWALGFTWAKSAQEAVNRQLDLQPEAAVGPLLTLGVRYVLAAVVMLAVVGRSRRGWSRAGVWRALALGGLLGAANLAQHLGLARTSEAVSAFLTSLTIVFVPLLMTVVLRRPPAPWFWVAVVLATAGIWLMTGATPRGLGAGEALGLACALVFSVHLIAINTLVPRDDPWRMAAGQFLVSGSMMLLICLADDHGRHAMAPRALWDLLQNSDIWFNLLLSLLFPTILSFVLLTLYQPRVDPIRVALIYLTEPIFAAAYAYVARGRSPGWLGLTGGLLIVAANLLVELLNSRRRPAGRSQDPAKA